jgi:hypothetical protein
VAQVVIIQFGGMAFSTAGLSIDQWLWCLFFGAGTLVWGQLVTTVPTRKIPKTLTSVLSFITHNHQHIKLYKIHVSNIFSWFSTLITWP